ncbi:MAG: prepilin peptidase [Candidatus Wallbacteria bacterium]|nr:prepilin peptidase [Candidatus Wallbacteria bacterium]
MIPEWFAITNIVVFSLFIGSFLNVCIYRLPLKRSIVFPSSHCTRCKSILKPIDLVPVLTWIFYRGRCRYCKSKISPRYPLVEILTAVLMALNYLFFGFSLKFVINSIVSGMLVVVTFIDFDYQIIPDEITIGGLVVALLFQVVINVLAPQLSPYFYQIGLYQAVFGAAIGGGLLYLIAFVSRGGMGGGDVKLAALLGALYGPEIILMILFVSFVLGGSIGLLLITLGIKGRKDYIPFGPYICLAVLIVLFVTPDRLTEMYYAFPRMF